MKNKLISVIMGVYNPNPKFLQQAVESILKQTYTYFEFIICDDGSDNLGKKLLRRIESLDPRIKLLTNSKNCGLAYTLNRCIQNSAGDYIVRMDDDDISLPNRFAEQVAFLEEHSQVMFVGSNIAYIDDCNEIWGERKLPVYPQKRDFLINSPFVHPTIMFRKEIFYNGNFYCNKKIFMRVEDYEFWMRCYYQGHYGANIQRVLLKYREDNSGMKKRKFIYRINEAITRLAGYYELEMLTTGWVYVFKPIIVSILPSKVIKIFHGKRCG